ncbi:MAG: hypothetical protein ACRDTJ_24695 [Pseudonocardiaceae bacterium]
MARATLRDLGTTNLKKAEREAILTKLTDEFFSRSAVRDQMDGNLDIAADLLGVVADLAKARAADVPSNYLEIVAGVSGSRFPEIAKTLLARAWTTPSRFDKATLKLLIDAVPEHAWTVPDGLAAKVFNSLWRGGHDDLIVHLIKLGADSNQSAIFASGDSGRDQEGVWSGFVQPLEHLLGNYLRLAEMKDDDPEMRTLTKVKAARNVLAALRDYGKPKILTSYAAVSGSPAMGLFKDKPGTIWGFEDVRLPYVQAAHQLPGGATPVRMWEIWEAVERVLSKSAYENLMKDPKKTIDECIDAGKAMVQFKAATSPHEYFGRTTDEFLKNFERQARAYLTFLSEGSVRAKHATAELNGRGLGKWMGALGCKAGLWWAKSRQGEEPVYYVLDGINMTDVTNYKSLKTKKVNTVMEATYPGGKVTPRAPDDDPLPKYHEVITLAEMREILTNWKELDDTVIFVEKGKPVTDIRKIEGWIKEMETSDLKGDKRLAPPVEVFEKILDEIDGKLRGNVDGKVGMKIVAKAENVRLAADAAHATVLAATLAESEVLTKNGVLPVELLTGFADLVAAKSDTDRIAMADNLAPRLKDVAPYLKDPLLRAINGQRPKTPTI